MKLIDVKDLHNVKRGDGWVTGESKIDNSYVSTGMLVGKFEGLKSFLKYQAEYQAKCPDTYRMSTGSKRESGFVVFDTIDIATDIFTDNPRSIVEFKANDMYVDGGEASGKTVEYDVTGDMLDVGRYLDGEPECFGSLTNGNPRNKRVNIIFHVGCLGGVEKSIMNLRGSRLVRLVDWLESQGVRTQVTGLYSIDSAHIEIVAKPFDEVLDINTIAVLGHSDFFRWNVFRFMEYSKKWEVGYGASHHLVRAYRYDRADGGENWLDDNEDEITLFVAGGDPYEVDEGFDALETELAAQLSGEAEIPKRLMDVLC